MFAARLLPPGKQPARTPRDDFRAGRSGGQLARPGEFAQGDDGHEMPEEWDDDWDETDPSFDPLEPDEDDDESEPEYGDFWPEPDEYE